MTEFQHDATVKILVDDGGNVVDIIVTLARNEVPDNLTVEPFEANVNLDFNSGSLSGFLVFGLTPKQEAE